MKKLINLYSNLFYFMLINAAKIWLCMNELINLYYNLFYFMLINAGKIWLCWTSGWWVVHLTLRRPILSRYQAICPSRQNYQTLGLWRLFTIQSLRSRSSTVTVFSSRVLFTTRICLSSPRSFCSTGIILWEIPVVTQSKWLNWRNATFPMGELIFVGVESMTMLGLISRLRLLLHILLLFCSKSVV